MEYALDDIQNISIDGASRSSRWKALRGYLKQIIEIADENSDRLSSLESETSKLRESNLKLTEVIQVLSDLANEEVQREVSLTLNDTDYDIVIDTPEGIISTSGSAAQPCNTALSSPENVERQDVYTIDEFVEMLKGAPRMGEKTLKQVAEYLNVNCGYASQPSLDLGIENGEIRE